MQNEWILDVLADLKQFAQQNGMGALATQLQSTRLVAARELASFGEGCHPHEHGHSGAAGFNIRSLGKSH